MSHLPLFDDLPDLAPQAARLAPQLKRLAEQGVLIGTSSWKYEGWLGSIYSADRYQTRNKFSKKKFDETCLAEYAQTFPVVGGDFAFYLFPSDEYWSKLFAGSPDSLLFALKTPDDITVATWPKHARYGRKAGLENAHFLDADVFSNQFVKRLEPYRHRLAPFIIEFGTFPKSAFATPADFYDRLGFFLNKLPEGFRYSIEIRNPEYLTPAYFQLLASHNVAHAFTAWTRMPDLREQSAIEDAYTADFTLSRALLKKGRSYEQAVKAFEPYDRTQEPNESAREGLRVLAQKSLRSKKPAFLLVNNRLEGNAPSTIEAVIDSLKT